MKAENLIFISEYFPPYTKGGAEISTALLLDYLSAKGSPIKVLTQKFQKNKWFRNKIEVYPIISKINTNPKSTMEIIKYGLGIFFKPLINVLKVRSFLLNVKPSIVNIVATSYLSIPFILGAILSKTKVTVDVRGGGLICPLAFGSPTCYNMAHDHKSLKCLMEVHKNKSGLVYFFSPFFSFYEYCIFKFWQKLLKKFLINHVELIIANSHYTKNQYILNGFLEDKIKVIYNPSKKRKYVKKEKKNMVVFAGILEESKGVWDVIKAFELLKNKNLILNIAGDGKEFKSIKRYLERKNLTNINLLGKISNEKVLELYRDSKLIVSPSIWPEPFGRFILESMATKTPLITTSVGGTSEAIKNGYNGLIVKTKSPIQIKESINKLIKNKRFYNKILKNMALESVKYSPKVIGNQRLKIYKEILFDEK